MLNHGVAKFPTPRLLQQLVTSLKRIMPNRKSKKAERKKAAEELEDMPGVDLDFKEQQDLQDKLYGSASSKCGNLEWYANPTYQIVTFWDDKHS